MAIAINVDSSKTARGKVHSIQHHVTKFVSDLRHVGGYNRVLRSPSSSIHKTDRHDITAILLKVALHTLTLNIWSKWWISGLITYFSYLTPLFRQRNISKNLYLSAFVVAYLKITFYYFSLRNVELAFWYYPSIDCKLGTSDGWQGSYPHNCSARPQVAHRGTPLFLV